MMPNDKFKVIIAGSRTLTPSYFITLFNVCEYLLKQKQKKA